MKVMICGPRFDFDEETAKWLIICILSYHHSWDTFIHGGAVGVDSLANMLIKKQGYYYEGQIKVVPPNYKLYNRGAPIVRNKEMVNEADIIYALWNGRSKGTKSVIDYARQRNKTIFVYKV